MEIGRVVKSGAGRDAGRFYMVVDAADGYIFIADGKVRRLKSPKRKNPKHLSKTNTMLNAEDIKTDKQLRKILSELYLANREDLEEGGN